MKKLWIGWMILMMSCSGSSDIVKDFIPGTYVRFASGEYSKAWDTLHIDAYDPAQGTYVIEQRTGFQRFMDKKLQPREYIRRKHIAVLDEQTYQLQDPKTGKYYTFSPGRETVLAGSAEYIKIK
jgi:hypothetical protein